jgi:hypothetical protein
MDRNTEVTLDQVADAIVATIAAKFPDLHVEAYRKDRRGLPVPACLVEMTGFDPDETDPGTGQLAVMATFEALFVIGFRQPGKNPKREVRKLAAAFAAFCRLQRWGCKIGPAEVLGAHPDDFDPDLDQFDCWCVEWQQVIHLGETVWTNDGVQPTAVFVSGQAPFGPDGEGNYQRVNESPPTDAANETTVVTP